MAIKCATVLCCETNTHMVRCAANTYMCQEGKETLDESSAIYFFSIIEPKSQLDVYIYGEDFACNVQHEIEKCCNGKRASDGDACISYYSVCAEI